MLNASLTSLLEARRLNPLNTDHTANLARLYRFWGEVGDPSMLDKAIEYYRQATEISPNTAHLYDEWSLVYFIKGQYEDALAKLQKSAALDAQYTPTFVYLGDVYQALNRPRRPCRPTSRRSSRTRRAHQPQLLQPPGYPPLRYAPGLLPAERHLDTLAGAFKDVVAKDPSPSRPTTPWATSTSFRASR